MSKAHLARAAAMVVMLFMADAAISTPASARWYDYPHAGYCPIGTCNAIGGWRALNVRNCRAANCWRNYR
jgi:hypothetical protein